MGNYREPGQLEFTDLLKGMMIDQFDVLGTPKSWAKDFIEKYGDDMSDVNNHDLENYFACIVDSTRAIIVGKNSNLYSGDAMILNGNQNLVDIKIKDGIVYNKD
jgi:hypothetical protein